MNVDALRAIRLRTPRLELRLGSDAELAELYGVAAAGIHPPDKMPFAVAWTDDLRLEPFVDHHRSNLANWSPDDWSLLLIAFLDGRPVGNQGINATRFAVERRVITGSWLGQAFQRRGLGTEMRTAVLELAFRGLGAEAAESGALPGNDSSMGVSRKLGYTTSGWSEVSPRGVPIRHEDLVLLREDWRPPFEVQMEGVEPALPLFGA